MNGKPILIKNGDAYEFPLCASDIKKDYGNAVDLTNVATYTTTVDGYLVSDSGDKPINKGTVINNPNKTSILFVPKRNSSLLPQETNASQIPCNNGSSNVQAEIDAIKWKLATTVNAGATYDLNNLPSSATEVKIIANCNGNNVTSADYPISRLERNCWFSQGDLAWSVEYQALNKVIHMTKCKNANGNDYLASSSTEIYYR